MKNLLLAVVAVFTFATANAQTKKEILSSKGENYLPVKGDWSIGFNANGVYNFLGNAFNGNATNVNEGLTNELSGVFVGKRMDSDNKATRVIVGLDFDTNSENVKLTAGLGKEWRKGSTRLQGYYGADALLNTSYINEAFAISVGGRGFVGAEYFVFPKVALGAEYSYGVNIGYADDFNFTLGTVGVTSAKLSFYF